MTDTKHLNLKRFGYSWSISSTPNGSAVANVTNKASANPVFTPYIDGDYEISLVVYDGQTFSVADVVVITASALPTTLVLNNDFLRVVITWPDVSGATQYAV